MFKKNDSFFSIKMIYSYLLLTILAISIGLIGFYRYYYVTISSNTKNVINQLSLSASNQVELQISAMDNLALQLVSNKDLIHIMSTLNTPENSPRINYFADTYHLSAEASSLIMNICLPSLLAERISIANQYSDYLAVTTNYKFLDSGIQYKKNLSSDEFKNLYRKFQDKQLFNYVDYSSYDKWMPNNSIPVISCIRPITDIYTFKVHGILELQRPFSVVEDIIEQIDYDGIEVYLLDGSDALIYMNQNASQTTLDCIASAPEQELSKNYPFSSYTAIEGTDWKIISVVPFLNAMKPVLNVFFIIAFIFSALLLFAISSVMETERNIRIPLLNLRESLAVIDVKNLSLNFQSHSIELKQLNQTFLNMIQELKKSIKKAEYLHNQDLRSQMFALQAQINPHFMHNTLTLISALAQELGDSRIIKICKKFSEMLSYSTEYNDQFSTLSQEISHAENYLFLMKERYEDGLDYSIVYTGTKRLSFPVPKIFLQPIVENCITHAFEFTPFPWIITIILKETEDVWTIEIHDNGCGFSEEARLEIFHRLENYRNNPSLDTLEAKIGKLGIVSTVIRMYLLYDTKIIFDIGTSPLGGGMVTIGGYKSEN